MDEYASAPQALKERVEQSARDARESVDRETLLSAIQGDADHFARTTYIALMQEICAAANPAPEPGAPAPTVVAYSSVVGGYAKPVIASSSDIDEYLSFVRGKLEAALADGKKIAFS